MILDQDLKEPLYLEARGHWGQIRHPMMSCPACGSLMRVQNKVLHENWHQTLASTKPEVSR